jgi:hypothetical protein
LKPLAFSRSGKTGQAAAFGRRAESSMVNVANGRKVAVAAAGLALAGFGGTTEGSLVRDLANDPQHRSLGQSYLMGGSGVANTGGAAGSFQIAVAGGGIRIGSGGFWNSDTYITTAHSLRGLTITDPSAITVSTGANGINSRGEVRTVSQIIYSPWGAGDNPNLPDIIAFRLSSPVAGINQAVIASAGTGAMLTHVGFGNYGDPTTGEIFTDGNVRGFRAPIQSFVSNDFNPAYYAGTLFRSDVNDALNGKGLARDSGGFVFAPDGVYGHMVASTLGASGVGTTYIQRWDSPEITSFLTNIPSPGAASIGLLAGVYFAAHRRRR